MEGGWPTGWFVVSDKFEGGCLWAQGRAPGSGVADGSKAARERAPR